MKTTLLKVSTLKKYFPVHKGLFSNIEGWVRAVDGVSFSVDERETLGLVGESGCGKTTVGKTIIRLLEPTGGTVWFGGREITGLTGESLRKLRKNIQIIFQDPISSLNPRMTIGEIIGEPLRVHEKMGGRELRRAVAVLLERVGLSAGSANRYPHEFSGGQRQRVGIARALALNPLLIVCDEPVSALDVSIQAQIINLLESLQEERGLSYLFISHDLRVVEHISHRVAVMYLGKIVEIADRAALYKTPLHPYTRVLLAAVPEPGKKKGRAKDLVRGEVASAVAVPSGCRFHPRCRYRKEICLAEEPELSDIGGGHRVACWLHTSVPEQGSGGVKRRNDKRTDAS
jgi:oligopeptide/dipeptide ABC transporter ATP-binding protein